MRALSLDHTDASHDLKQRLESCLECVNANGGFQVALWCSRGEITDLSLVGLNDDDDAQVDSGRINRHVVHVQPMNKTLLDNATTLGGELSENKLCARDNL